MTSAKARDNLIMKAAAVANYDVQSWNALVDALALVYDDARDDLVLNVSNVQQAQGKALMLRELLQTFRECREQAPKIRYSHEKNSPQPPRA